MIWMSPIRPAAHLSPRAGRGRIALAIRVRGSLRKRGRNRLEDASQILRDIVVPKPQDAIVAIGEPLVANGVALTIGVLFTVDLHNQAAFATDKVYGVRSDRLLSDELVSIQPAGTKTIPERAFGIRQAASQSPRTLGLGLISTAQAEAPPHPSRFARRPLPASGERRTYHEIS
ncbi:hypothetical protein SAMN05444169_8520 [Bradyrhizobium erythrophlei]|jgi:hypothetical protein|uniref:Uncharacterized protein n=1 Tax=Bradyrhizobium erythrophlei TaxID=1437360 RepID=A0A1M5UMQ1_9BRAD|nr:hypothetical protein SAMN05444169_8520 [Bradyrhizobium erythrophlei]